MEKPLFEDTPLHIKRVLIEGYRRMTPAQKRNGICELNRTLEQLAEADIRRRYPDATDREVRLRVASRRIPADLMRKAFGWNPDVEGY